MHVVVQAATSWQVVHPVRRASDAARRTTFLEKLLAGLSAACIRRFEGQFSRETLAADVAEGDLLELVEVSLAVSPTQSESVANGRRLERKRKFVDSPLEGTGFELLVSGRGEAGCRAF